MLKSKIGITEVILSAIALLMLLLLFFKAVINIDTGYDAGWYHLPFAARIWGIIPKESFLTEKSIEYRYQGFPLLAHFFQGLLWKVTGRIQSTNLVGYFSVIGYLFFLRTFFQIPLYLSTIAILAIPAVLTHSTTSFVDLPGNIGVAISVMMLWKFSCKSDLPNRNELLVAFLGAVVAANVKPQLTVSMLFIWFASMGVLARLWLRNSGNFKGNRLSTIIFSLIASILIFATSIKNVALYQNPVYPIKVEVAGVVLNHKAVPQTYKEGNRPQKWLRSILEINTPEWTAEQYNHSGNPKNLDRAGGFFGAYVVFNLLLLTLLNIYSQRRSVKIASRNAKRSAIALAIITIASIFVANFPQSHELRYFMFWMIVLVSFNLHIISTSEFKIFKWLKSKYLTLVYLGFLILMSIKIDSYFLKPVFKSMPTLHRGYSSVEEYVKDAVKPALIEQMIPNERVCLISRHAIPNPDAIPYASIANAIFYASYFHPEVDFDYSIQAVTSKNGCGDLPKIP